MTLDNSADIMFLNTQDDAIELITDTIILFNEAAKYAIYAVGGTNARRARHAC